MIDAISFQVFDSNHKVDCSQVLLDQRWKKRQTLQTCLCCFSQLVLIFRHRARKTMREECFTHCIIITGAISINNAFSCYLQICHSFIGHLRCFVANLFVLIFFGPFLYLCYFNRFLHLWKPC